MSVSVTTRKPRPGEENGKDYFFISEGDYKNMVKKDELLEHALIRLHVRRPHRPTTSHVASKRDRASHEKRREEAEARPLLPEVGENKVQSLPRPVEIVFVV